MRAASERALEGVRVLDLTRVLAGPFCSMLLGDLGADVIKIEQPGKGDDTRSWGPPFKGNESAYFMSVNRNKRSMCVDFKKRRGQELIQQIALQSDVLIENFLPNKLGEFHLDYDTLARANPRLVYCSISGFGSTGPMSQRPGYDVIVSAMYGLMSITGPKDGPPVKPGVALTDVMTGLYATSGIMAALFERERSGRGQHVQASLMETQLSSLVNVASNFLIGGQEARRWGTAHESIVPYQGFQCKDGVMVIGAGNDKQFRTVCKALGCPARADDPQYSTNSLRVQNRQTLVPLLEKVTMTRTRGEWSDIFKDFDFPYGPVRSVAEAFQDEQTLARGMVTSITHPTAGEIKVVGPAVKFSRTPATVHSHPPLLGEHTRDILTSLCGLDQQQVEQLVKDGIVS